MRENRAVAELDDDVRRLFQGANFGHVATLMPDGSPQVGFMELPFADRPGGQER